MGFCPSGVLFQWGFVLVGFCPVGFCPSGVCPSGVLSYTPHNHMVSGIHLFYLSFFISSFPSVCLYACQSVCLSFCSLFLSFVLLFSDRACIIKNISVWLVFGMP